MAPPLPPPGQLIAENLILLSGSSSAFYNRYGHHISPTTFSKPGNSAPAHAVLHFLICVIDGDLAHSQFKPCFPILDREQERDFRRVVDNRLSVLEKNKLLPPGAARKSVIAAAGGDRFVDMLWSLSALAVQQACVRHPPYASPSRLRMESPIPPPPPSLQSCGRADSTLSHQSSARSSRSLMSVNFRGSAGGAHSSAHDVRVRDASKQRRFLSAGMVNAAQQRAREAESVRSRIHAERTTLARTAELGKVGEKTWASEAESLRERIGEFEAKVRRLKGQLADMGFDEMGNDIRGKGEREGLRKSCSREEFSDELKTSPIESMESGSSVDELLEPVDGCEDIAQDLSRILAFAAETKEARQEVERVFPGDGAVVVMGGGQKDGLKTEEVSARGGKPTDMVQLVRAAADELEQATRRMDEIQEARKKAEETEAVLNTGVDGSERGEKSLGAFDPSVGKARLESALLEHKNLVESSQNLAKVASELTEISRDDVKKIPLSESDDSLQTIDPVATIPKPTWLNEAAADASEPKLTYPNQPAISDGSKCSSDEVDTARDVQNMCKAISLTAPPRQPPRPSSSANSRRVKASPPKVPERHHSRHVRSNSASMSPRSRLDSLHGTPSSYLSAKAARSVRFAALPPSYSANRTVGYAREETHLRARRQTSDVFPRTHDTAATAEEDDRSDTEASDVGSVRDDRSDSGRRQSNPRRVERRDTYARKDLAPTRRAVDERPENQTRGPRVLRTQTPRRVVRRKEAIQRAVVQASAVAKPKATESKVPVVGDPEPTHSANFAEPQDNPKALLAVEAAEPSARAATIAPIKNKTLPETEARNEARESAGSPNIGNDGTMVKPVEVEGLSCADLDTLLCESESGNPAHEKELSATRDHLDNGVPPKPTPIEVEEIATGTETATDAEQNSTPSSAESRTGEYGPGKPSCNLHMSTEDGSNSALETTAEEALNDQNSEIGPDDLVAKPESPGDVEGNKVVEPVAQEIAAKNCNNAVERIAKTQTSVASETDSMPPSTASDVVQSEDSPPTGAVEQSTSETIPAASGWREHRGDTTPERLPTKDAPIVPTTSKCGPEATDSEVRPAKDNVQKKLFVTPQPSRGQGRDRQRSPNLSRRSLAWKAAGSLLGNKYPSKGNSPNSHKKDSRQSGYLPPLRGASPASRQGDDVEILFSPAVSAEEADMVGPAHAARIGKGEGFFAGQTAQWQHSVQSQRAATGGNMPSSSRLSSSTGALDSSNSQSRETSTSSARKSRIKSLRARLAAALK